MTSREVEDLSDHEDYRVVGGFRGSKGMEKKMETTVMGLYRV